MLILGEKEAENENISVRKHRQGDVGSMSVQAFIDLTENEISKSISNFENK
jgi:threonyl-tRNA synthetase